MKQFLRPLFAWAICSTLWIAGCGEPGSPPQPKADAVAVLVSGANSDIQGEVRFADTADGVRVMARIDGLSPGDHGFHIHEFGDCRSADFASAGAHYNPLKKAHGGKEGEKRHTGDLGNIEADADGVARVDMVFSLVQLDGADSVIGRSVVVHSDPDDFTTQPAGGAGQRIACGVIGIAAK